MDSDKHFEVDIFFCFTPFHLLQALVYTHMHKLKANIYIVNNASLWIEENFCFPDFGNNFNFTIIEYENFQFESYLNFKKCLNPYYSWKVFFNQILPRFLKARNIIKNTKFHAFAIPGKFTITQKAWYLISRNVYLHEDGSGNYNTDEKNRIPGYQAYIRKLILTKHLNFKADTKIINKLEVFELNSILYKLDSSFIQKILNIFSFDYLESRIKKEKTIVILTQCLDLLLKAKTDVLFQKKASSIFGNFINSLKNKCRYEVILKTHPSIRDARELYDPKKLIFDEEIPSNLPSEMLAFISTSKKPFKMFFSLYSTAILNTDACEVEHGINLLTLEDVKKYRNLPNDDERLTAFETQLNHFLEDIKL